MLCTVARQHRMDRQGQTPVHGDVADTRRMGKAYLQMGLYFSALDFHYFNIIVTYVLPFKYNARVGFFVDLVFSFFYFDAFSSVKDA